jgi:integrase
VTLTHEGTEFFQHACAGRAGDEVIFRSGDREWRKDNQRRPPIGFHGLRHTWASHAMMNGVPLMVVARNLGHANTKMVEEHYGHLAPGYVAEAIRAGAPRFGAVASNVRPLAGR